MPADADLSPPGVAKLIADFLAALDLDNVTLVGNDTGGAICQVVVTRHPDRIGRLVLTNCDAYDDVPALRMFKALFMAGRIPGFMCAIAQPLRIDRRCASSPIGFGWLTKTGIPAEQHEVVAATAAEERAASGATRAKLLKGAEPRATRMEAARQLQRVRQAGADRVGAPRRTSSRPSAPSGSRATSPRRAWSGSRTAWTFVSEDQPERLARADRGVRAGAGRRRRPER